MLRWWYLGILNRRRYDALTTLFSDLDTAWQSLDAELLRDLGLREDGAKSALDRAAAFDGQKEAARLKRMKIDLCCIDDPHYPAMLREIADPPVFLSSIGDLSIVQHPCIGVVGTRRMTDYGRRAVSHFVPTFARSGVVTVSGLALGVDSAVARDTLDVGGKTVAVLGHGLSTIYPKTNERLAQKIVDGGGVVISEFPPDVQPDIYTFPARNRIIAGLSIGTLVAEAPLDSGAVITANLALEYGRDVFAVPGMIFDDNFAGCHRLIAEGHARLVTEPEEVLREIGVIASEDGEQVSLFLPKSPEEEIIYSTLSGMPQSIDSLILRTGLDARVLGTTLTFMELAGAVRNVGAGQWIKN
jgi:DNA processing protein